MSLSGSTPPPPTLSLFNFTRTPITPTPILRLLRTPTLRSTGTVARAIGAPTLLTLPISPPTCYETPVGSLWCLGIVHNALKIPIEQVSIHIYLVNIDGFALTDGTATLALSMLEPGKAAPYSLLFDSIPEGYAGPVVLVTVETARSEIPQHPHYYGLSVHDTKSTIAESLYKISGVVTNNSPTTLSQLKLVVTLFDGSGRVTGFRQLNWPAGQTLAPQGTLPFEIEVMPQGLGTTRIETVAEGRAD